MAASDPTAILEEHDQMAQDLVKSASDAINSAADALSTAGQLAYQPFQFTDPVMSFGAPDTSFSRPGRPSTPNLDKIPTVKDIDTNVPVFTAKPSSTKPPVVPVINIPGDPSPSLPGVLTAPGNTASLSLPNNPTLLPLGDTQLPFPTINLPAVPQINQPVFAGTAPDPIRTISLQDYLTQLSTTYTQFSSTIPALVQSNWRQWYATMLSDHPMVATLLSTITTYLGTGGAGLPVPIEQAIVTRAQARVGGEGARAHAQVYADAAKRGLWMPSGALLAGLKETTQQKSEAVSKVTTDLAIKHVELEQSNMQFMLSFGQKMEAMLQETSVQLAKITVECNGQAIELTKTVLTGMIEINKAIVSIYLAQWEGYKAAVEWFKAQIEANMQQVQLYEAQIRAELAKTEVNKAKVEMIRALAEANNAVVNLYKTQIEAESLKLEIDRVRAQIFEAQTRGYVAQVEAFRARWEGYKYQVEGQLAKAQIYESQVKGYLADVQAFLANAQAYDSQVKGYSAKVDATAKINDSLLRSWTAKADGQLKAFGYGMQAYATEWTAAVEQLKIQSTYWQASMESVRAFNSTFLQQQMETGREHLTQWVQQLEGSLRSAQGLTAVAGISQNLASSMISGVTSLAAVTQSSIASG